MIKFSYVYIPQGLYFIRAVCL